MFSVLSTPKLKRGRRNDCEEEICLMSKKRLLPILYTINDLSVSEELSDEEDNEVDTQIASDAIPGSSSQCCGSEENLNTNLHYSC